MGSLWSASEIACRTTLPAGTPSNHPCHLIDSRMYTDWTAVALLLFTAVPLLAVVATTSYFIWQKRKKPLP